MTETTQERWTIKRLLDWTVDFFQRSNSTSSRLDAEILLAEAMECERIALYTRFDEVPNDEAMVKFRAWVKRRAAGEPVAYLVGHREFYSLSFEVTPDVLIPRPETEHVIVAALEFAKRIEQRPLRIIDVGTGSGCIAITLAKHLTSAGIESFAIAATDLSAAAIEVAKRNAERHEVNEKIRFFQGDLLEALPNGSQPVHMIVSNPPYIGTDEKETLDTSVRDHEPSIALFGGALGTEIIDRLIEQSKSMLVPGGGLIFETSPINIDRCVHTMRASNEFDDVTTERDYAQHQRVVIGRRT